MNRKDAKVVLAFMEDKTKNEDEKDALLMAIDALSVDGELISRADAIDAVCRDCTMELYGREECEVYKNENCGSVNAISALPSAEAENESCGTCKYFETSHREYPCSDCTVGNSHYVSAEPTAEEVWSVAQKVFHSTLTYREAVDYVKEVEKQHERFNQQSRCD